LSHLAGSGLPIPDPLRHLTVSGTSAGNPARVGGDSWGLVADSLRHLGDEGTSAGISSLAFGASRLVKPNSWPAAAIHPPPPTIPLCKTCRVALFFPAMNPVPNNAPVFALDETTDWEDLENAISASADYQSRKLGKIIPLMFFAPLTTPENLDAWEPMKTTPDNLLIVSMERSADEKLIKALELAKPELGELKLAGAFPAVQIDFEVPLAEVYQQMEAAGIAAYTQTFSGPDAPSFFFLRGGAGVLAFDRALRQVTR
jgi:hypothetical protein